MEQHVHKETPTVEHTGAQIGARDLLLGVDFGSDSVRALLVSARDGKVLGKAVRAYPRWAKGMYCDARAHQFRQHPLDYIEAMTDCISESLAQGGPDAGTRVAALGFDTTASTPALADASGAPLALDPRFSDDPDAMFILWKDHSSIEQAETINRLCKTWGGVDYAMYEGGIYSAEWFWSKALRVVETRPQLAQAAATIVEHGDWIPALLSGIKDARAIPRGRCLAGFKAMWHASWGGYPCADFLRQLHPRLASLGASLPANTLEPDRPVGTLCAQWAARLGIAPGAIITSGSIDAHVGAVGAGIGAGAMLKIMGTSTCDIIIGPEPEPGKEKPVPGICGQSASSVIPGYMGYEAGQSAFGDILAWLRSILAWPLYACAHEGAQNSAYEVAQNGAYGSASAPAADIESRILPALEKAAEALPPGSGDIIALDWLNGRRTPDANQRLAGAIAGLRLGTDAPELYRALVEAAAFGSRAIAERFVQEGVFFDRILATGGVAKKSAFVMQTCADIMGCDIGVAAEEQSCALGAAMYASVACSLYPDLASAQKALGSGIERVYRPRPELAAVYDTLYERYKALGAFMEHFS